MTDPETIYARDLRPFDVWLGEDGVELEVSSVVVQEGHAFVPWTAGRNTPPVPMAAIIIVGEITRPGYPPYNGSWTLQEDQPLEVRRLRR